MSDRAEEKGKRSKHARMKCSRSYSHSDSDNSRSRSRSRGYRSRSRGYKSRSRSYSRSPPRHRSRSRERYNSRRSNRYSRSSYSPDRRRNRRRSYSRSPRRGDYRRDRSTSPLSNRRRHVGNRENPGENSCIGVFGLSLYTTERDLRDVYSPYGPLESCNVVFDHQTGRSRGFAFVTFQHVEDARDAKVRTDSMEIDGRRIRVDFSITKRAHTPTPGIYMGHPTPSVSSRNDSYQGHSQSRSASRSRSRSRERTRKRSNTRSRSR